MGATKLSIHTVEVGTDRMTTRIAPLARSLGLALSNSGDGRVQYTPPSDCRDSDVPGECVHLARDADALVEALTTLTGLVIVAGHGAIRDVDAADGEDLEWQLSSSRFWISMRELQGSIPRQGIPADALIISACNADRARHAWRDLLVETGVLFTTRGWEETPALAQWMAGLLTAVSNQTGRNAPDKTRWKEAYASTKQALRVYEDAGGGRKRVRPGPADLVILNS